MNEQKNSLYNVREEFLLQAIRFTKDEQKILYISDTLEHVMLGNHLINLLYKGENRLLSVVNSHMAVMVMNHYMRQERHYFKKKSFEETAINSCKFMRALTCKPI